MPTMRTRLCWLLIGLVLCWSTAANAQTLTGPALVKALQAGGHVIVMRHGSSPGEIPKVPNPDNVPPERQLDEVGRATTTAIGEALRRVKIRFAAAGEKTFVADKVKLKVVQRK